MAAITDLSDMLNLGTGGGAAPAERVWYYKDNRVAGGASGAGAAAAGRISSLWTQNGIPNAGGTPPAGSGEAPTAATVGAINFTNPGGGRQKWLIGMSWAPAASTNGTVILYDRLVHTSGLDGTVTSAQAVNTVALTRNTAGDGNQIWLSIFTQIGATPTTVTASYTNQAGTAGRTTVAVPIGGAGWREIQRIITLPLQGGDMGVRSVQSVTLAGSTGTAGGFGVIIAQPLLVTPDMTTSVACLRDLISGLPGVTEVVANACLALAVLATGTPSFRCFGTLNFLEK